MKLRYVVGLLPILWSHAVFPQLTAIRILPEPYAGGSPIVGVVLTGSDLSNNIYDSSTGELRLQYITSIGTGPEARRNYENVVLQLVDDGRFDLTEFDEITPEEECTEEEVEAAIPQLSLELSLTEAQNLIGCFASISPGATDLEMGRTVNASWRGNTIVSNPGEPRWDFFGSLPVSVLGFGPPVIISMEITLSFLEGNLVQYSFSEQGHMDLCRQTSLITGFESLILEPASALSYDQTEDLLNCSSSLLSTSVSLEGTQTWHSWTAVAASDLEEGTNFIQETITALYMDDTAQSFSYSSRESNLNTESCSIEELTNTHELILEGSYELELLDLVPCPPRSVFTNISDGITRVAYSWNTDNSSPSIFFTNNRALTATIVDGYVSDVQIYRN